MRASDEGGLTVPPVHHDVTATLNVAEHRVEVVDAVRLAAPLPVGREWRFLLHSGLEPTAARLGEDGPVLRISRFEGWNPRHFWRRPPYAELAGWDVAREIAVAPPPGGWGAEPPTIVLEYAGVIADSLLAPERAYDRSFETTTGRIVDAGAYLAGSTFWVPWSGSDPVTFDLEATGPVGWRTVSQGGLAADVVDAAAGLRTMTWSCGHPMEEIYLIAGPYELREIDHRGVKIQTFCYAGTGPEITDRYLLATGPILDEYDLLFGPYPFPKFALVENYWQTGYGMPSFTFLGDKVIRLPFIVSTSYPHEILHNWWGNGVHVDYEGGNWCEGLTSYCADYRAKEREGPEAARDYRRNALIGYRDFAMAGERDFALARFRGRDSAATQAVGYGKTLMVFHMLRRKVGDREFFAALRRFYAANLFRAADWDDVRRAFEEETGRNLEAWFEAWIERPGAIGLTLTDVAGAAPEGEGGSWSVTGTLRQDGTTYDVDVPVRLVGPGGEELFRPVRSSGASTPFEITAPFRPVTVSADPAFELFRRLHAEEVAPTLSGILGAEAVRIVVGAGETGPRREALHALADEWADGDTTIVVADELPGEELPDFDGGTWYFGRGPAAEGFRSRLPGAPIAFAPDDSRVEAGRHDGRLDRPGGILWPASAEVVPALGRKIPHYSKYSFLSFEGEKNVAKGQWEAGESPMTARVASPPTANEPEELRR